MVTWRLDKWISSSGLATRRQAKRDLAAGRVTVNGCVCRNGAAKVSEADDVRYGGRKVEAPHKVYFVLNKPAGILTAARDAHQPTVMDLFPEELRRQGIAPVGRLDKDTTGLLLVTNDGGLAHRILSPRSTLPKVYRASVEGEPDEEDVKAFAAGITLGDGTICRPAGLENLGAGCCLVTVTEGKYHQVRRMLASRGHPVTKLERISIGGLVLDETLPLGKYRELGREQLYNLLLLD